MSDIVTRFLPSLFVQMALSMGRTHLPAIRSLGTTVSCKLFTSFSMTSQKALVVSLIGLATVLGLWLLRKSWLDKGFKLPPQVPGIPVFGNTFQIPALQQGPWAKKLAEKYGEM